MMGGSGRPLDWYAAVFTRPDSRSCANDEGPTQRACLHAMQGLSQGGFSTGRTRGSESRTTWKSRATWENWTCWMYHYLDYHREHPMCMQAPDCPDDDPFDGH